MQMDTRDELLPCPFCGNPDVEMWGSVSMSIRPSYSVGCGHCGVALSALYNKDAAATGWNRRPSSATPSPAAEADLDLEVAKRAGVILREKQEAEAEVARLRAREAELVEALERLVGSAEWISGELSDPGTEALMAISRALALINGGSDG